MEGKNPLSPEFQYTHQYGQYESSQLSSTFLDGLRPLAESSAIRSANVRNNLTYTLPADASGISTSFKSPSSHLASFNILNLDSLPSKLMSLSTSEVENKCFDVEKVEDECIDDIEVGNICLDSDELRLLEEAFSEASTGPKDTGAIATTNKERVGTVGGSPSSGEATNASSMPSLSSNSKEEQISGTRVPEVHIR